MLLLFVLSFVARSDPRARLGRPAECADQGPVYWAGREEKHENSTEGDARHRVHGMPRLSQHRFCM